MSDSVIGRVLGGALLVLAATASHDAGAAEAPIARDPAFETARRKAIDRGVAALRTRQSEEMGYRNGRRGVGTTALAYVALRAAGVAVDDPVASSMYERLRALLDRKPQIEGGSRLAELWTDELGLACRAIAARRSGLATEDPADRNRLTMLVAHLQGRQELGGDFRSEHRERSDHRMHWTRHALTGLAAAQRAGVPVRTKTWADAIRWLLHSQHPPRLELHSLDGSPVPGNVRGWSDTETPDARHFQPDEWTTAPALHSLVVACEAIQSDEGAHGDSGREVPAALRDGAALLHCRHWVLDALAKSGEEPDWMRIQWAYDRACAGDALGLERFGSRDWFGEGVRALIELQGRDGAWGAAGASTAREGKSSDEEAARVLAVEATSHALLFLARATDRVRWPLTRPLADTPIDAAAVAALPQDEFERFVTFVLSRWRREPEGEARTEFLGSATAVGPRIVPSLLGRMESARLEERVAATAFLVRATGLDQGFDPEGPPDARLAAIRRWRTWWKTHSATLRYDADEGRLVP